jgi:hypothetical protein
MALFKQNGYGSQNGDDKERQKRRNSSGYDQDEEGTAGKNSGRSMGFTVENPGPSTAEIQSTGAAVEGNEVDPGVAEAQNSGESSGEGSSGGNGYQKSDAVRQAEELLRQHLENKPGEYQSEWQAKLDEILNQILNREKFSYDLNGDALYQQYKDQYVLQGQQAMMDTMGQAQAMTGGYGNSYAQGVGQQTYQGYLQQLNNQIPELYELALSQYNREGEDLYNQYGMYMDRENEAYGRYRDQMADYYAELDRLAQDARYQREDDKWQQEFDEAKRQYEERYGGGNSDGGNDGNDSGNDNYYPGGDYAGNEGIDADVIKQMQRALGITADGMWGPQSQKAAGGLGAKAAYEAWKNGKLGKVGPENDNEDNMPRGYHGVAAELDMLIRNGASKSEINQYLSSMYRGGYISLEEYNDLRSAYRPVGLTY